MTDNEILRIELLSLLGSVPKTLRQAGPGFAGQLAVKLGNAVLRLSHAFERGKPDEWQPLDETPLSLYALGKQLREVGLEMWDKTPGTYAPKPDAPGTEFILFSLEQLNERVQKLEAKKGGRK